MILTIAIVGTMEQHRLRIGEKLSVGSSSRSQVRVADEAYSDVHFVVGVGEDHCWLECSSGTTVSINGDTVNSSAPLNDQDIISYGQTSFRVSIEGQAPGEPPAPAPKYTYSMFEKGPRLLIAESSTTLEDFKPLFEDLLKERNAFLLANYVAAKEAIPSKVSPEEDLFLNAPAEIRQEYSLFCIQAKTPDELWGLYEPLRRKDAATLIFTTLSREELLKALKFHFAWYAIPSSLRFHLSEGSEELVRQLLSPVTCLFGEPPSGTGWWCIADKEKTPQWNMLGLRESPSNVS